MHELISHAALARATNLSANNPLVNVIARAARIPTINRIYRQAWDTNSSVFLDRIFSELNITLVFNEHELERIPSSGAFIIVANHPFGAIDGLALIKAISKRRPDFKIMANYLLQYVEPLRHSFISVDPFVEGARSQENLNGIKACLQHLQNGHPLGIFPSGEVSTYDRSEGMVVDRPWSTSAIKLMKKSGVPIIPVYFNGENSRLFHTLGTISPRLRTLALPSEFIKKSGSCIKMSIGHDIQPEELCSLADVKDAAMFLRARTYAVGYGSSDLSDPNKQRPNTSLCPIASAIDINTIKREFQSNQPSCIAIHGHFRVYSLSQSKAPNIVKEIGRLREKTFREVGEGTGKARDLDGFDEYYIHLVVWDAEFNRIVGAYRIGHCPDILRYRGVEGLYVNTLFSLKGTLREHLHSSAELGRSFIVKEYQKHRMALYMLWSGIESYLAQNPEIHYLIGPVSISGDYHPASRQLINSFFQKRAKAHPLANEITPRRRHPEHRRLPASHDLVQLMADNVKELDKAITRIEPSGKGLPVLLKKYVAQNAAILAFNVDPDFNYCLDGFIYLEVRQIPQDLRLCLRRHGA